VSRRLLAATLLVLALGPLTRADAQPREAGRRLTTIDSLRQFPGFFNLQNVLLRGEFVDSDGRVLLKAEERQIEVLLGDAKTTSGEVEVRAQLLDVGRLEPTDPRLVRYQGSREPDKWPKPGEELLLNVSGVTSVSAASTPSVRALALEPWKFEDQTVTLIGQFRGRNLFGDLPGSPARSKYDFVLRGAEGAIWVSGLRPKGKGFDLNVDARADTGHWVKVTGTVKRERTMVMIEATAIAAAEAPSVAPEADDEAAPPPPLVPGDVVFSTPTDAELDVPAAAPVRIQFSRGLNPATLAGNIRIAYVGAGDVPAPEFQATYDAANRAIEVRFAKPVEPFRTQTVETLEGLRTFDGAPVTPWKLTFTVGG
jgi:hypothetical protein